MSADGTAGGGVGGHGSISSHGDGAGRAGDVAVHAHEESLAPMLTAASPGWADALPFWIRSMQAGRSTLLVALRDGDTERGAEAVGIAQLLHDEIPEVCNVGVLAAHRGAGIGTALIREAEHRARPVGRIRIGVAVDNPDALRLYQRLGYQLLGEQVTTSYDYVDAHGVRRHATETDEWMEKDLTPL